MTTDAGTSMPWALQALRLTGMPADEIGTLLSTDDPLVVHRVLELHGERLAERYAEQRERLRSLERFLVEAIGRSREEAAIAR